MTKLRPATMDETTSSHTLLCRRTLAFTTSFSGQRLISRKHATTFPVFQGMDDDVSSGSSFYEHVIQPLCNASNSSTLENALEALIKTSADALGRSDLGLKNILAKALQLLRSLSYPSDGHLCILSLKLLRNLCAGEVANQNSFIDRNGVQTVLALFGSVLSSDSDCMVLRAGLQTLANVSLAGEKHQHAIWRQFFPDEFAKVARVRRWETCDPLCMIIFTSCDGNEGLLAELCGDQGLVIVEEIVRSASAAIGFKDNWLKLLLSRLCLEETYFPPLFSRLHPVGNCGVTNTKSRDDGFTSEQAYLLRIVSEILNERLRGISVKNDFALYIFGTLKKVTRIVDFFSRGESSLPTGSVELDVLGYSLTILRDICALDRIACSEEDVVDSLLSSGLLELLLGLLSDLEPPTMVRKARKQKVPEKVCPYRGFRRDLVAVIGNCSYGRKHVQDEIREKGGILLMLQQCVVDEEENPFLREWGIWAIKNIVERNGENQREVAELEIRGCVDVPGLDRLALRVEVDQKTRQPKLVNVP